MSSTFQPTSQEGLASSMDLEPSAPSKTAAFVRVGLTQGGQAMMLQKPTRQVKFAAVVEIAETSGKEAPIKTATSNRVSKPVKLDGSSRRSLPIRGAISLPAPTPTTSLAPSQESGMCVAKEDDTPSKMAELEIVVNHTKLPAILKALAAKSVVAEALRLAEAIEVAVLAAKQTAEKASSLMTDTSLDSFVVRSEAGYADEEEEGEQMPWKTSFSDRHEDVQANSVLSAMEYAAANGGGSNTRENIHFAQFTRRKPLNMSGNYLKIKTTFLDINTLLDCPRLGVTPHDRMESRFNLLQRQVTRGKRMSSNDITELVNMKRKKAEKEEKQNILKGLREKNMLLNQKKQVSLWKPYGAHIPNTTKFNQLGAGIGICRDINSPSQSIRRVDSGISGFSESDNSKSSQDSPVNPTYTWYDNLDGYQSPSTPSTNNDKIVPPEEKSDSAPSKGMLIGEDGVAIDYEALMNEEIARENIKAYLAGYYLRGFS